MDVSLSGLIAEQGAISAYVTVYGILACYVFLGIAIIVAVVFPAIQMFQNFKSAIAALAGIGALVLLFLLCYSMSAAETFSIQSGAETITVDGGQMKAVEACLYLYYIMLGFTILCVLVTPLFQYIKK